MKEYTVGDYYGALERMAPFSLAESWDNAGLLIGSKCQGVPRALVALDATPDVIEEAKNAGARLIITHHPVIFKPVKSISADSPVYQAIAAGIAVISAHTNLDISVGGVNDILAQTLELTGVSLLDETKSEPYRKVVVYVPSEALEKVYEAMSKAGAGRQGDYAGAAFTGEGEGRFLPLKGAKPAVGEVGKLERVRETRLEMLVSPRDLPAVIAALRSAHPYEEPAYDVIETHFGRIRDGIGRVGDTKQAFSPDGLAAFVRDKLGAGGIKYAAGAEKITRVAVCGGSGGEYIRKAAECGAQALVTADVKHSQLLEAKKTGLTLIDAGHYATEAVVLPVLLEYLREALPGADIDIANRCGDPARYLA